MKKYTFIPKFIQRINDLEIAREDFSSGVVTLSYAIIHLDCFLTIDN